MDMDQDGSDDAPAPVRGGAEGDPRRRSGAAPGRAGAVDRHCTVGHTIEHGASYTTTIVDPDED